MTGWRLPAAADTPYFLANVIVQRRAIP